MAAAGVLAACGGGTEGTVVEGDFARGGLAPTGVWVVESQRAEAADSTGFRLADLTPGPVSIRLLDGADTAAVLNVSGLPPGARLALRGLRVDGDSRYAFPRAVELDGAEVVTVNGVRMAPAGRVPREVDVRGALLGWSSDVGAMLLRPADPRLPDLRVVVGMATEFVGTDGGMADPTTLQPGDSLRVEGRADNGYVVATRVTVPTRIGSAPAGGNDDADDDRASDGGEAEGGGGSPDGGSGSEETADGAGSAPAAAAPAPAPAVRPDPPGRGHGRGGARGRARGKKAKG